MAKYQDIVITPNAEQSSLLLKALDGLPDQDKRGVMFQRLYEEVRNINTVWERRIKNEKLSKGDIQSKSPPARRWTAK